MLALVLEDALRERGLATRWSDAITGEGGGDGWSLWQGRGETIGGGDGMAAGASYFTGDGYQGGPRPGSLHTLGEGYCYARGSGYSYGGTGRDGASLEARQPVVVCR